MRATIFFSSLLLCGTLTRFPGVEAMAFEEIHYNTLTFFLLMVFTMDIIELIGKVKKG